MVEIKMRKEGKSKSMNLRSNKIEENLLMKRLKQLSLEEAKNRLQHERISVDLIYFLKDNRVTTGYYSDMFLNYIPDTDDDNIINSLSNINSNTVDSYKSRRLSVGNITPKKFNHQLIKKSNTDDCDDLTCGSASAINICENMNNNNNLFNNTNDDENDNVELFIKTNNKKITFNNQSIRPHTAFANVNEDLSITKRRKSAPLHHRSTDSINVNFSNENSINNKNESLNKNLSNSTTNLTDTNIFTSSRSFHNNEIIKLSKGSKFIINNSKYLRRKYLYDFYNTNNVITPNLPKSFIQREKTRIINENKTNRNVQFISNLRRIQSNFDMRVKEFSQNAI